MVVSLTVGPKVTADLVDLGWLPAPDCDKGALTHALIDLIERALEVRVGPALGSPGFPAATQSPGRSGDSAGAVD